MTLDDPMWREFQPLWSELQLVGLRSTYRNRPTSWPSLCTGRLLNRP